MVDVRALWEYNIQVRHRYFDALSNLSWDEFSKNREASFNSMKNIFLHIMNAIDYWLDFLQGQKLYSCKENEAYRTHKEVDDYMRHVETRMQNYLNSLSQADLLKKYAALDDDSKLVSVTGEDVLVHVFEEEIHHRGELVALFWQMNIKPPLMSWKGL